jgi:hypothetical protein
VAARASRNASNRYQRSTRTGTHSHFRGRGNPRYGEAGSKRLSHAGHRMSGPSWGPMNSSRAFAALLTASPSPITETVRPPLEVSRT